MSAQVCRERARERPRESAFAGAMALQPRDKAARQRKREKAGGTLNELAAALDGAARAGPGFAREGAAAAEASSTPTTANSIAAAPGETLRVAACEVFTSLGGR